MAESYTGTLDQPYQYTGRELDFETGLYYYRARYYNPSNGTFISEDPTGFSGGLNLYEYSSNSPEVFSDPLGLQTTVVITREVPELTNIHLDYKERTGHLPQLIADLITRLRLTADEQRPETTSAHDHGKVRFEQHYTVAMLVEESRLLQVSIFDTLRLNQNRLDLKMLLADVVTIADECDAQLRHTVETFMELEKRGKSAVAQWDLKVVGK
jgi:RHS repeat-associated protein